MTGAFLNAMGILLGGLFGLARRAPLSARVQFFLRKALGLGVFISGARLVWLSVNGTLWACLKQFLMVLLAVVLGFWLGKLMRLQKLFNRVGHYANGLVSSPPADNAQRAAAGFSGCAILFCAAPLGWIGAVADGLSGYFWLLAVKGVMDGLAMAAFVKMFRWPVALSAIPVWVFLGAISMLCGHVAISIGSIDMLNSVNAAAGMIACAISLMIFEVRRVEMANFLPALVIAPLLMLFFR
jgi:uncharacterized protein